MFFCQKVTSGLLKRILLTAFFLSLGSTSSIQANEFVFPKGSLAIFAPPLINKNYYLLEFGFVTQKKIEQWNYNYNAYVTAALFEDWSEKKDKLRAGALGFKAGVFIPTHVKIPLLLTISFGFAKTALHHNPLFGNDDQSVAEKDMFLIESGLLYRHDKYFIRFTYQRSNVGYFSRHTILMLGVSY